MGGSVQDKKSRRKTPAARLLAWYDVHRRVLPWRALPGQVPDPYRVWLSEIMLQQTGTTTVAPYFAKFLRRWPTVQKLAAASEDDIRREWAGLGYYRRASNLHACAREVARHLGGVFPNTEAGLLALPGLGPYTAAAILAIAFDKRANVVDGNVERVVARYFAEEAPLPTGKKILRSLAATLLPEARFGDYAQAMMDLGATVCTPRNPECTACPLAADCKGRKAEIAESLPRRNAAKAKPLRRALAFIITSKKGLWLRRRPDEGLLARMEEVPSSLWQEGAFPTIQTALRQAGLTSVFKGRRIEGVVTHSFTHFDLEIIVHRVDVVSNPPGSGRWVPFKKVDSEALPSIMQKILRHGLQAV